MNLTIGAWIVFLAVGTFIVCGCSLAGFQLGNGKTENIGMVIGFVFAVCLLFAMNWWYGNTASGRRAVKSQESNLNNGIEREVKIYSMNGDLVETFTGKIDIDYKDDRIMFDDERGLRHVIYFPSGTVVVNEVGDKVREVK